MVASSPPQRPRPVYLALLGVIVVLVIVYMVWPAASQPPVPSNAAREPRTQAGRSGADAAASAGQLDVQLQALKQPPPVPDEAARNPFRFYVKPPPPPPPPAPPKPVGPQGPVSPPPPVVDPGPPPIPLKFIGTLEQGNRKVAIFSDGRGAPIYGKEGDLVLGQYKIVRIGVESVVMEYADGKGRQTIPMRGQ
ncbi:MAG: hypothetical protein ABIQ52_21310 [Vicinamibacterales bacterium]